MCHFTVALNRCSHLSQTYKNVESCSQENGKCDVDLNAHLAPDKLTEVIELLSASKGYYKRRYQSFIGIDASSRSVVSFEINDDTACSRCAPMQYARYLERQERLDYEYQKNLEAKAAQRNGEVIGGMIEELDLMIDEGHRRGSVTTVKEGKNSIGAGLRKKAKPENLRALSLQHGRE